MESAAEQFVDNFIEHHGVKGMKWGVRRDQALLDRIGGRRGRAVGGTREERKALNKQAKSDWKNYKSSTTRKERRADRKAAVSSKADYILEKILKEPTTLLEIRNPGSIPTLATGKEMIDHLSRGGAFNPIYTDISSYKLGQGRTD